MTARSHVPPGLLALATAALLAACTSPAAARPSQLATAEPTLGPEPSIDCHQITIDATDLPPDLKMLRKLATEIVVAEFSGFGPAFWTTPDGHRPTAEEFAADRARLVRPIEMEVQGEIRGRRELALLAVARGGASGCDQVTYNGDVELEPGARYIFFLHQLANTEGELTQDRLMITAWKIGPDEKVKEGRGGNRPLAEVEDEIKNGPKPGATPEEPEPTGAG